MSAKMVASSLPLRCEICGGEVFAPGPGDRLSACGVPPSCVQCGSLERHRVLHRLLEALPGAPMSGATALQISRELSVPPTKFKQLKSSNPQKLTDIVSIPQFDWIFALYILEMVADEGEFIQELLSRTNENGIIVLAVSGPPFRSSTAALIPAAEGPYRVYGSDFPDRIAGMGLDLAVGEIVAADTVTATLVPMFVLCRQQAHLAQLLEPLSQAGFYARICHSGADAVLADGSDRGPNPPAVSRGEKWLRATAIAANREPLLPLRAAIEEWKSACGSAPFFLRDDDAARDTPRLQRLFGICRETNVQVMLSVIPGRLQPDLVDAIMACEHAVPVQHGYRHESHSTVEGFKSEFPDEEALAPQLDRVRRGFEGMTGAFGDRFMPILVPPWNNISHKLVENLAELGIAGLSCSGRRGISSRYEIKMFNSWVSLNDFARLEEPFDPTVIIDRYLQTIRNRIKQTGDRLEPIGLTTHHLVTSEVQFRFLHGLIETVQQAGGLWLSPGELMSVNACN
jgi:hypothetical protein